MLDYLYIFASLAVKAIEYEAVDFGSADDDVYLTSERCLCE